jgi:NADH-dependant formate dehydrogenase delta subunit FdsD
MNIDLLIKMSNEITAFFVGEHDEAGATREVANHLRRYWDPRMRAQIITYYEERQGAGLVDIAKNAVAQLAAQSKASASGAVPPPQAAQAKSEFSKSPDPADPYGGDAG